MLEEYERALHDNAIPPEDTRWCDGWLVAARVEVMRDNVEEAEYWLSRVDQTATTYCWPNYEARVLMERGNMARRLGDLLHAKNLLNRASLLLAEHGTEEDRIDCADKQTYVALAMGDIEASHRLAKEAIDYYCQQPDEDVPMALAYVRLSYTQRIRGLLDEARANMQTACAIFEKLGARRPLADARSLFAEVAREQGNFDEARDLYDSAMSLYRAIGAQDGIAAIEAAYSILLVLLERYEEARIRLLAVMEGHTHRPGHLASLHGTLFPCAAHSADWEKAEHHLAETNTLTKISGFCDKDLATTVTIGGDIAARAGKMALAERAWTYAANVYERLGDLEMAASLHAKSAPESG